MKTISIITVAMLSLFATGCDVDELVDEARAGMTQLAKSVSKMKSGGAQATHRGATPGTESGIRTASGPEGSNASGPGMSPGEEPASFDQVVSVGGDESCGAVLECAAECFDDACVESCLEQGSEAGLNQLVELVECAEAYGCQDETCLEQVCFVELTTCFEQVEAWEHSEVGCDEGYGEWDDFGYEDEFFGSECDEDHYDDDDYGFDDDFGGSY